ACAEVELAAPRPKPCPPPGDVPPVTPDFVPYQAYRDPAPDGIDAFAIQQLTGAMGTGVTVLEIEWGWWFDHEDLSKLRPGSLVGPPGVVEAYNWHGLGVIGILAADADRWGVSGLVPDIDVLVASSYPATGYNVAAAVVLGLTRLRAGDVILIAAQIESPLGLVPIEWNQPDFDAIQNATRLGVAVLETGANGAVDLDDRRLRRAFDLSFRDSGAIIVGASAGRLRERAWFSSFGSRIDANGWGLDVITTGYGDLFGPNQDRRQTYTMAFSGTSSATPMVTAAVVALRGAANAQLAPADANSLDWRAIRALLRAHGTPMQGDARIGLRPDMRRLFRAAGLERGLRLRSRARLGQMVEIEISPEHARTGEGWLLLAARAPANLPLSAPFLGNGCDRLLLDPATTQALAEGVFTAHTTVLPLPVPTEPALHDQRFYLQAVRVRADGTACATNSVLLLIEP
ncbi:MAG TPA: S8 family serine peptidase, partial [Planctomycetota bacterium]|nr:S8 family serine peptidase [Planctomycetota bacterium]